METFNVSELRGDSKNPRTISEQDYKKLMTLLARFGDLSGIVKNVRTGVLVGGHMRVKAFVDTNAESQVQITQRLDAPSPAGTVALGAVVINGEPFSYREVDWDEPTQRAANIAANRAGGEFDKDMLAEITYELSQLENADELLSLTAMSDDEIKKLLKGNEPEPEDESKPDTLTFRLSPEHYAFIEQTLAKLKANVGLQDGSEGDTDGKALVYLCQLYNSQNQ